MIPSLNNRRTQVVLTSALVTAAGLIGLASVLPPGSAAPPNPRKWDWIEGTTWYVKPQGLPAMIYDAQADHAVPFSDQTVYTIQSCHWGYFVGSTTLQYGDMPIQCRKLIGSVTPEGTISLTFIEPNAEPSGAPSVTRGTGVMRRVQGAWTMENQMCTQMEDDPNVFVQHWAYMFQVAPGDAAWNNLPGVDMSVPDFMAECSE